MTNSAVIKTVQKGLVGGAVQAEGEAAKSGSGLMIGWMVLALLLLAIATQKAVAYFRLDDFVRASENEVLTEELRASGITDGLPLGFRFVAVNKIAEVRDFSAGTNGNYDPYADPGSEPINYIVRHRGDGWVVLTDGRELALAYSPEFSRIIREELAAGVERWRRIEKETVRWKAQ